MLKEAIMKQLEDILKELNSIKPPDKSKRTTPPPTTRIRKVKTKNIRLLEDSLNDALEDSLNLLMVTAKYIVLDIEATRRENDTLKKLVKDLKKKLENH